MRITSGLDFGTTNSTIGYNDGTKTELIELQKGKNETRTVIFENLDDRSFVIGDKGIDMFIEGYEGRLLQSLKSFLNTREEVCTILLGKTVSLTQIINVIVRDFKSRLERVLNKEVTDVLVGRPVNFHDDNKELDILAQKRLEQAVKLAGFKNVEFQFEPIAAARSYQVTMTKGKEEKIIVIDLGGGTSDFSILNLNLDNIEVIGNSGIYIGGDNFDNKLSYDFFSYFLGRKSLYNSMGKELEIPDLYYRTLSDWKEIHKLGAPKTRTNVREYYHQSHNKEKYGRLLEIVDDYLLGYEYYKNVEMIKRQLSTQEQIKGNFNIFKNNFDFLLQRALFNELIQDETDKIIKTINELIIQSGIKSDEIDKIFLTGGTSFIPCIQNEIEKIIGKGKIIDNDRFLSIGYGLTKESYDRFR